jgi:hypothetical protein
MNGESCVMSRCDKSYIVCHGEYIEGGQLIECCNEKDHAGDHLLVVKEWVDQ